jgi:hypothetical protein
VENFDFKPITNPQDDIAAMMEGKYSSGFRIPLTEKGADLSIGPFFIRSCCIISMPYVQVASNKQGPYIYQMNAMLRRLDAR